MRSVRHDLGTVEGLERGVGISKTLSDGNPFCADLDVRADCLHRFELEVSIVDTEALCRS